MVAMLATPALARHYSDAEWKAMFIESPKPDYPLELRRQHLTGRGLFRMYVDEQGKVTSIKILKSIGHRELDAEAMKGFIRWRAKPGTRREVDMPITFTMNGR
jgi:TonB family protein